MPKKKDKRDKSTYANPQKEKQPSKRKSDAQRNDMSTFAIFVFDSAYQIVTWVLIAASLGILLLFWSKDNYRGVLWGAVGLACSISAMLGLLADRYFFQGTTTETRQHSGNERRPYVFIKECGLKTPLAAGEKVVIQFLIENSGLSEATVKFWDNTYYFDTKPFKDAFRYLSFKPSSIYIAPRASGNGEFRFDFVLTEERLKAIQSGEARLYFFSRGEYKGEDGTVYPFPFCRMYDKDIGGNLVICPDEVQIGEQKG